MVAVIMMHFGPDKGSRGKIIGIVHCRMEKNPRHSGFKRSEDTVANENSYDYRC